MLKPEIAHAAVDSPDTARKRSISHADIARKGNVSILSTARKDGTPAVVQTEHGDPRESLMES